MSTPPGCRACRCPNVPTEPRTIAPGLTVELCASCRERPDASLVRWCRESVSDGRCLTRSCPLPAAPGRRRCEAHLAEMRVRTQAAAARERRARAAAGRVRT